MVQEPTVFITGMPRIKIFNRMVTIHYESGERHFERIFPLEDFEHLIAICQRAITDWHASQLSVVTDIAANG